MKKLTVLMGILFVLAGGVQAQEITRGQLMNLYYKAQKAEKVGNTQEALTIYKDILSVDINLPTPYLKMANIYATNEDDTESLASAVVLYKRYLTLNPTDKDAETINQRIAQLQQKASITNPQEEEALINQAVQGGNIQSLVENSTTMKSTVSSDETNINALWQKANAALDNKNYDLASNLLNQLINIAPPNHPLFAQANIMLANVYGNKGDINQMSESIDALESYIFLYERALSELSYYDAAVKNTTPFEDDLCGIWVSDYSNDINGLPYVALEISKSGDKYDFRILPYCTLVKKFNMYEGKPFNLAMKSMYSPSSGSYYLAKAAGFDIYGDNESIEQTLRNSAKLYFGAGKFKEGNVLLAKAGIEIIEDTGKSLKKIKTGNFWLDLIKDAAIDVGVEVGSHASAKAAASKNTVISIDMDMKRIFAGCMELTYNDASHEEKSDGGSSYSSSGKTMMLYKLYPNYDVKFVSDGYELFGDKTFSKSEIIDSEAYKYVSATKDRKDFNRRAYKKLYEKVSGLYQTLFPENQYGLLETLQDHFEYATQGLTYQTLSNKEGRFEGWMDTNGRLNGWGRCTLKSGYEYVGEWKHNDKSGTGKLTIPEVGVYSGMFVNGKFQNRGIFAYYSGERYEGNFNKGKRDGEGKCTFANGDLFDGVWKNDKPVKGKMTYANGEQYERKWISNKKETQARTQGKGGMIQTIRGSLF